MKPKFKVVTHNNYSCTVTSKLYKRKYEKGKIVYAAGESPGICVFKDRWRAEKFAEENCNYKIKRVQTIGKGKKIERLFCNCSTTKDLSRYFRLLNKIEKIEKEERTNGKITPIQFRELKDLQYNVRQGTGSAPAGTYAYPGVKVLD